jgi:hypothetical protein
MIAAIVIGNVWFPNFIHVISSLLWTGIDLFMGFVLGPIPRRTDISMHREVARCLTPRTLFPMPAVPQHTGMRQLVRNSSVSSDCGGSRKTDHPVRSFAAIWPEPR